MKNCTRLRVDKNGDFYCGSTHVCYKHYCGISDGFLIKLHPKFVERVPIPGYQLYFNFDV